MTIFLCPNCANTVFNADLSSFDGPAWQVETLGRVAFVDTIDGPTAHEDSSTHCELCGIPSDMVADGALGETY